MQAYALLYILDEISLEYSSLQVYIFYRFQQSCWLLVVGRANIVDTLWGQQDQLNQTIYNSEFYVYY